MKFEISRTIVRDFFVWRKVLKVKILVCIIDFTYKKELVSTTKMVVSKSLTPAIFQRDESYLITTNGKQILLSEKLEETKCAGNV